MRKRAWFALAGMVAMAGAQGGFAQTVTNTIKVPLWTQNYGSYEKLGIWATLGGGTEPQLFEFDTGGDGFYAAYDKDDKSKSPWWGTNWSHAGPGTTNTYDSGNVYVADPAATTVAIYGSSSADSKLLETGTVVAGQTHHIFQDYTNRVWPGQEAPVDGAFYGDFGLSLKSSSSGIENVLAQMTYTNGVKGGFIVHVGAFASPTADPFLQIGLTHEDIESFPYRFKMTPGSELFPGSNYPTYSLQVIDTQMTLSGAPGTNTVTLGLTLDTGNPTPGLHNQSDEVPAGYITNGQLLSNLLMTLLSDDKEGVPVNFYSLFTGTNYGVNYVYVQDSTNKSYLNVGMPLFYQYDVMFDFESGVLGLRPVPEISQATMMAMAIAGLVVFALGRSAAMRVPAVRRRVAGFTRRGSRRQAPPGGC